MDRRTFLARGGTIGVAAAAGVGLGAGGPWRRAASAQPPAHVSVVDPRGTTLERTLLPAGDGYRHFTDGPGRPVLVRDDLAGASSGREDRRTPLATIVHLTDVHVIDAQSPARVEFVDRLDDPSEVAPGLLSSAWRPQETLCGQIADAMARQLRAIGAGPVTGRGFDCAVTTGDSTDNMQFNELDWFLDLLAGGRPVAVNSGDPDRYEGVQDGDETSFDASYWHPGATERSDHYKDTFGYPDRPELLDLAIAPFTPVGLPCPWYSVYGNHDGLLQGNAFDNPAFSSVATGPVKVVGTPSALSPAQVQRLVVDGDLGLLLTAPGAPVRAVTPDEQRSATTPRDWVLRHRQDRGGPGPVGHGLSADAADTGELHYTFEISPDVLGIGLDTVNRTAYASGSLDRAQFAWLEQHLIAVSSRYLDTDGREVRTSNTDRLVVLFAHHGSASLDNPAPDLTRPEPEPPVQGPELVALLHRFPNVVAFVVGHNHRNRAEPRPSPTGDTGGFWEITTAAHIDHPQQSRILEVADNQDGTLSIFSTIFDHAGPTRAPDVTRDVLDLASLARELSLNDVQKGGGTPEGGPEDTNVELLLTAPFPRAVAPPPAEADEPATDPPAPPDTTGAGADSPAVDDVEVATVADSAMPATAATPAGALPETGSGAVAVGAALLAGAVALRSRQRDDGPA